MKNNETNDLLNYGYKIIQNSSFFKFSLDSVLLAEFVKVDYKDKKLMDLCTGNAPLPLILSKKIKQISGIEIQKPIYLMATESIKINNIENVKIINDNVKNLDKYYPKNHFDIITCNPPYFKYNETSIVNDNDIKTIARHEKEITLEEIIKISKEYLVPKGKFYLVHKPERLIEIIELLNKYKFGIKRLQICYNSATNKSNIILIEAKKDSKNNVIINPPLFTEKYERGKIWN